MAGSDADGFVPVDGRALHTLDAAIARLSRAEDALSAASGALLELAGDLKVDAVRRLLERGASGAQVERYEAAYEACAAEVRASQRALDDARAAVDAAMRAVRG